MKIALCLSGQPRCFDLTWESFKTFLFPLGDVDIFCHFWEYENADAAIKQYNPKLYTVEKQIDFTKIRNWKELIDGDKSNAPSMFYSTMKSFELKQEYEKENNFKYDVCIKCRTDIRIYYIHEIPSIQLNHVFVPLYGVYEVNDQMAIGDSVTMDKYSQTYSYLLGYKKPMHPETILKDSLADKGVQHRIWHVNYELLRDKNYGKFYWEEFK